MINFDKALETFKVLNNGKRNESNPGLDIAKVVAIAPEFKGTAQMNQYRSFIRRLMDGDSPEKAAAWVSKFSSMMGC